MNKDQLQKTTAEKISVEICDLIDRLGFTSEYHTDPEELKRMLAEIILKAND